MTQLKKENMKRLLFVVIIALAVSCQTDSVHPELVDFEKFTMKIPGKWKAEKQQGYDSQVWQIEINSKEKLSFDLGWYSDRLEVDPSTHNINFTVIDNKRVKVVSPRNFGPGTTGVYFDSLETTKTNRFQMSGTGLSPKNQKLFLSVVETLKFKD